MEWGKYVRIHLYSNVFIMINKQALVHCTSFGMIKAMSNEVLAAELSFCIWHTDKYSI